jgi:hypothetical protein
MATRMTSRVEKLENRKQLQDEQRPYKITSACGRVTATVDPRGHWPMAHIKFSYPELSAEKALDLIAAQLPPRCGIFVASRTEFTLEEYRAWIERGGQYTDGSPILFGRFEQTVH